MHLTTSYVPYVILTHFRNPPQKHKISSFIPLYDSKQLHLPRLQPNRSNGYRFKFSTWLPRCIFLLATKTARMINHIHYQHQATAYRTATYTQRLNLPGRNLSRFRNFWCSMLCRAAFIHNPQFWPLLYFQLTFIVRVFWFGLEFDVTHCWRSHTVTNY
jgi:hypothetical protein